MITVDTLTPLERSAYNEGCKNGKKEVESELKHTRRALCLLRAEYADLQVYANVNGIGMGNGKECDFFAKSRDYWAGKAAKFKEE